MRFIQPKQEGLILMYKDQVFAIGIIVLLAALCFFLAVDSNSSKTIANKVIGEWVAREERLVSLCQIDYTDALIAERDMLIKDNNDFVIMGHEGG